MRNEIAAREEGDGEEEEEGENGEEEEAPGVLEGDRLLRLGIDDLSDALEGLQTVSAEERGAQAKLAKKLATSLSAPKAYIPAAAPPAVAGSPEAGVTLPPCPRLSAHPLTCTDPWPHRLLHRDVFPSVQEIACPCQSCRF